MRDQIDRFFQDGKFRTPLEKFVSQSMFLSGLIYHIPFWSAPAERSGDGALDYFDDNRFRNREP